MGWEWKRVYPPEAPVIRANRPSMSFNWSMMSLLTRLEGEKDVTIQVSLVVFLGKDGRYSRTAYS